MSHKAIVMNYDDLSFVKVRINSEDLRYIFSKMDKIDDILLRSMVWKTSYDMVKDAKIKSV